MSSHNKSISYVSPALLAGLPQDAPVLLAFSGGADSSALLHLLLKDSARSGFRLYAAHFNHNIRKDEALRDLEFCRTVAQGYGVPFFSGEADVPALARERGESLEAAAREERYAFFERIMSEHGIPILVTAHHAEDHAESVLIHLMRGSGVTGLRGISPSRDFGGRALVRPLLEAKKADILEYCAQNSISFVTDSTNADTAYLRNAIRAAVLPELYALAPELDSSLARSRKNLTEADGFIDECADRLLQQAEHDGSLSLDVLKDAHPAPAKRAIAKAFARSSSAMLEGTHLDALLRLCYERVPHSALSLPDTTRAKIENGKLFFEKDIPEPTAKEYSIPFFTGERTSPCGTVKITVQTVPSEMAEKILSQDAKKELNIILNRGRINNACFFRSRRGSDTVRVNGMSKSLKKLMCEKKIDLGLRDRLPLLCCGDEILWAPLTAQSDTLKKDALGDGPLYHINISLIKQY